MNIPTPSPVQINLQRLVALRAAPGQGLPSQRQVLAVQSGGHLSRFHGRGMEFAEVRAYQPGDDVRSIDWRVTARRGKVHTKLFHEERERPVLLALDYRRPMFFATRGRFKSVLASELTALLAWRAQAQGDRVGGFIFSDEGQIESRPAGGRRGVLRLLQQMVTNPAWQRPPHLPFEPQQRLAKTIQGLRRVTRPGSLVLLLSDFNQWDDEVEKQLAQLARQAQLALYFVYDSLEAELPRAGSYRLSDGDTDLAIATDQESLRNNYRAHFAAHQERIESFCKRYRCQFYAISTVQDPQQMLQAAMTTRGQQHATH
ncbi:Protein of unknown function DUF58 [Desulfuromusa kysingii]|uniref:DUF58 domain-containing protein n=1 Tax=Desulfuromusa kysingii TaxID=37625 RepID=A0A1H3ZHH4_9BACT|nr:DUF58 domain-containing protein [Desulfuromusa kysingii]SEA23199.1 Protein of unknown function DUF58 [Desulfuromusa kysingii]